MEGRQLIISIGRQCGSGGHEIGEKLASYYGIKLYDRNVIPVLAERMQKDPDRLAGREEKVSGHLFGARRDGFAAQEGVLMNKLTESDQLFLAERGLIQELAEKESFVIIGRGANAILADHPNTLRLYVYAQESFRLPRVREFYHLDTDAEAKKKMEHIDKVRREYFEYYTGKVWGSSDVHDFSIDSSIFGIDETVEIIKDLAARRFGR